jgi:SP family xylose:H+ symportor-like MFS transporter
MTWLNTIGWRYMFLSGAVPARIVPAAAAAGARNPALFDAARATRPAPARCWPNWGRPPKAEQELAEIRASLAEHHSGKMYSPSACWWFSSASLLSVFQQFVGINVVLYYAPEIFKGMGLSTNASLWQTIIVGAVNLVFTVVAVLTVDNYGRKPLQIIGALVMAASMIALGANFALHRPGHDRLDLHAGLYRRLCRFVGAGDLGAVE